MNQHSALVDNYRRRFTYLRLSVTDVCNFRCNYCLPDGYLPDDKKSNASSCASSTGFDSLDSSNGFLSLTEIAALVKAFALSGTKKIRLTGGEATLRKDLPDIIRLCKSTPGIEQVALTSNGYRITHQLPELVDAGLDQLNLSADSLNPSTFALITGHDKLREVMAGLDLALGLGLTKVKLNVVLLRENNFDEFADFVEFVRHKPISLRFIELMQTTDNVDFFRRQHVSGQALQTYLEQNDWLQVLAEPNAGPAIEYTHPEYDGKIGLIMPYSKDFCSSCNRLRVSAEGNLHLCLFAEEGISLRPYLLNESASQLAERIQVLLLGKKATHELHEGLTGATKHLAMLGG
ncbi:GTP 3',8-cyclase MoaA [Teredinibacter waterburyi]|uniref:GTP 3',8-cyclase MoaA n=1 Tax=Teredinibacter waterburyi TaxID=1500538 RepID=UPI00165F916C|nr:GTP 3',8-cyclase MoaA [Teredinibacter waterburyi]